MDDLKTAFEHANNFYIHFNKIHVGRKIGKSSLFKNFAEQKKIVAVQLKSQYISLFDANIDKTSIQIMAGAMGITEQDFLNTLNKELATKLQNEISINKLQSLYRIVKKGNINEYLDKAVQKKDVESLAKVFQVIAQALSLLESGTSGLGAILLNSLYSDSDGKNFVSSFTEVGKNLESELEKYKINNNYKTIKKESLDAAKQQLLNLSYALKTGQFKTTGNDITAKGLSTLLLNGLISTQIAQGLAFSSNMKAGSLLHNVITHAVGTKNVEVISDIEQSTSIRGKTDIRAKGVHVELKGVDNGALGGGIDLNIGISSKFYTGQGFNERLKNFKGVYGSGSGGTLGQAISAIWGNSIDRYSIYNYFAHEMYQSELNDLIATRQVIRLFSSAGSESDFANFMLLNGKIVSIWDIVKYAISSDLSVSKSQKGTKAGIVLTIPNRRKIVEANSYVPLQKGSTQIEAAWTRSRKVNSEINSARIYADLHLNKLAMAIPS